MTTGLRIPNRELPATTLTKREYFAGLAMAEMAVYHSPSGYDYSKPNVATNIARSAVAYADALIAELSK